MFIRQRRTSRGGAFIGATLGSLARRIWPQAGIHRRGLAEQLAVAPGQLSDVGVLVAVAGDVREDGSGERGVDEAQDSQPAGQVVVADLAS